MNDASKGRWVRRGSTIVIELPEKSPAEHLSFELETSQPTLRRGSSGSAVKTLQARLQTLGFDPGPIDGIFGSGTDSAVRAFQRARGLGVDGIVGPQTWAALYASPAPAPSKPSSPPPTGSWGGRTIHLSVPFYGYQSNDKAGCFRRCTEMAAAVNVRVGGPDVRIQVAIKEDTSGRVTIDPAKAREGVAYIDSQLSAGHPVCVGVSYTDASYNVDDITDHFVLITTRGTDPQTRRLLRVPRSGKFARLAGRRPEHGQPLLSSRLRAASTGPRPRRRRSAVRLTTWRWCAATSSEADRPLSVPGALPGSARASGG